VAVPGMSEIVSGKGVCCIAVGRVSHRIACMRRREHWGGVVLLFALLLLSFSGGEALIRHEPKDGGGSACWLSACWRGAGALFDARRL